MASLLDPLPLGPKVARNRIVFGPHETNLARRRAVSERHVAYYRRRAVGGAGVIVVEEASVHPSDWPYERCPLAADAVPGWAAVAEACHPEGALVVAALGHSGGQGSSAYSQAPLWAPSRVPEVNTREVPKWMEAHEIAEVVAGFEVAARAAVAAGCDGVEVNAGQHSLVRQFLSGLTNHRADDWGLDRGLFARQVLEATRRGAGPGAVVGLRLCGDELAPWAGITPETAVAIAADLGALVDWVTVVRGSIFTAGATRPDGHVEPGFNLGLTRTLREAVPATTAVIAQGSIVALAMAEGAVADGTCDGVEMTRAQIADPDLVRKAGRSSGPAVRPCLVCNQTCMARDVRNPIVTCVVEPSSGHEDEEPPPVRTEALHGVGHGRADGLGGGGAGGADGFGGSPAASARRRREDAAAVTVASAGHHAVATSGRPGVEASAERRLPGDAGEGGGGGGGVGGGDAGDAGVGRGGGDAGGGADAGGGGDAGGGADAGVGRGGGGAGNVGDAGGAGDAGAARDAGDAGGKAPLALRVLVVGGGVAGLETARVAADLGHHVTLVERDDRLGGMVRTAAAGAGRHRLALAADWLEAEVRRLGVEVHVGRVIQADEVDAFFGEVVLCTGSLPGRRTYGVEEEAVVLSAAAALGGTALPEGRVLVWDPIGGPVGISVAERLRAEGREVALLTPDLIAGNELGRSGDLAPANVRLELAGVVLEKRTLLRAMTVRSAHVEDRFTGQRRHLPAAALVDAGHRLPDDRLWRTTGGVLRRAGDAVAPRTIHEAILEGRRQAHSLGRAHRPMAAVGGDR